MGEEAHQDTMLANAVWVPAERGWRLDPWLAAVELGQDLEALRGERWNEVKAARDRAEWWGCSTVLGRVDTDPISQRKVSGAVQLAMIASAAGQTFSLPWTMQDNTSAEHDAPAMIALGIAVGQHVAACHAVALGKRAAIEAAADLAGIAAVDVDEGWPDAPA